MCRKGEFGIIVVVTMYYADGPGRSEGSWSVLGKAAKHYSKSEPTMFLDFSEMGPEEIDTIIVHQFGHALGLGHALMRSDDWRVLKEYVDPNAMAKSFGLQKVEDFEVQWTGQKANANYDNRSVMLYK